MNRSYAFFMVGVLFLSIATFPTFECRKQKLRLRAIKCNSSGRIATVQNCRIKTYNRSSYYSLAVNLSRSMVDGRIFVLYERLKQLGLFEPLYQFDNLEFCQILLNTSFAQYIPLVAASIHHLIQFGKIIELCRGSLYLEMSNVTWDTFPPYQLILKGEYRFNYRWLDRSDDNIFSCSLHGILA